MFFPQYVIRPILTALIGMVFLSLSFAQEEIALRYESGSVSNELRFEVLNVPEMAQVREDSLPYWSFFWEFGDGSFTVVSKDPTITHRYPLTEGDSSDYEVSVYLTPRYAGINERPLKSRIQLTLYKDSTQLPVEEEATQPEKYIKLVPNQEPAFGHEVRFAVQYAYDQAHVPYGSGHVMLFFNEALFDLSPPFDYDAAEVRTFYGEEKTGKTAFRRAGEVQQTIRDHIINQYGTAFSKMKTWRYDKLSTEEYRNLFLSLQTTDTISNTDVNYFSILALVLPDSIPVDSLPLDKLEESPFFDRYDFEIKRSLDPNHMYVNLPLLLANPVGERLTYKVDFQNIGEAPATKVTVEIDWPEYFDKTSLKILDYSPSVSTKGNLIRVGPTFTQRKGKPKAVFTFDEIDLRGTQENPPPLRDLTEGYVEFSVIIDEGIVTLKEDKEGMVKKAKTPGKIQNQALIFFYGKTGKEDSLKTNRVRTSLTRRRTYLSLGLNLRGWDLLSSLPEDSLSLNLLNTLSFGVGRNFGRAGRVLFQWELAFNGNTVGRSRGLQLDSIRTGNLDLTFNGYYPFRLPVVGMFRVGLGAGGAALIFAGQGGGFDYRIWDEVLGDENQAAIYDPFSYLGYVELGKSFFNKTLELSVRYTGRYYTQLAGQTGAWFFVPQISLIYRMADSKTDYIDELNARRKP